MRRVLVVVAVLVCASFLAGFARADYEVGVDRPTCTGPANTHSAGWNGALSSVAPQLLGKAVPIIKMRLEVLSFNDNEASPYLIGVSDAVATSTNHGETFWTTGAIHSSLKTFVAFVATTGTVAADWDGADFTFDFVNQTITLANNSASFVVSDVTWYNPMATLPSAGSVYWYMGGRNVTGNAARQFIVPVRSTCTGGDTDFVVGTTGTADRWYESPSMIFQTQPPAAPSVPQNVTVTALPRPTCALLVEWDVPLDDGGEAITEYRVYRSTVPGVLGGFVGNSTPPTLAFTDDTGTPREAYYYNVSAVNSVGEGPKSNQSLGVFPGSCDAAPIGGPNGAAYGGDQAALAASLGITTTALGIWYGLVFVIGFGLLLFVPTRHPAGAVVGGIIGTLFDLVFEFFPPWLVVFILMGIVAGFFAFWRRGSGI